jgi:hypothetical protein
MQTLLRTSSAFFHIRYNALLKLTARSSHESVHADRSVSKLIVRSESSSC